MAIKRMKIVADFETTTDKNDLRVWAVCAVDIETNEVVHIGNDIAAFFDWLKNKHVDCYFHNLKFDAEYLLPYILGTLGFKHLPQGKNGAKPTPQAGTFDTLITDDGLFYTLTVYFDVGKNSKHKKVTFYDSLKKLPFRVSEISSGFGLQDEKLVIDYEAYRPIGHTLTEKEKQYIINDCKIVAQALNIQFDSGLKRMTNASDAINWYKDVITKKRFKEWFPPLPIQLDADIRRAYKGGYVYLNPKYKGKRVKKGLTYDVNSLYPSRMKDCLLPFGYPRFFEGEPEDDPNYPLFIVRLACAFELKEGHLPMLQLKNNRAYVETEYLTSSRTRKNGPLEIVEMTLTSVDLKLFLEHYDTYNLEYDCGYRFKAAKGMFKQYIEYWDLIKKENTGQGSKAKRQLAKLMLNSLYGKFAAQTKGRRKIPFLDPEGIVRYELEKETEREPVYTAMACFITAYARDLTIRSAQSVYDRFIYADTDSLHIEGHEVPENLDIHPKRMGAWKHEGTFIDSKYLRAKTYMETMYEIQEKDTLKNYVRLMTSADWVRREKDGLHYATTKVTCAGMPDNVKELVTYENFNSGETFYGKLMPRRYVGGVVLEPSTFTIK